MKRGDLIRHLAKEGCEEIREGGRHTVYRNKSNGESTGVPRHNEIDNGLVRRICKQLGIKSPPGI